MISLKKASLNDLDQNWISWLNDKDVNFYSKKKI